MTWGGNQLEERVNTVGQAVKGIRAEIAGTQAYLTTTGTKQELMGIFGAGKEELKRVMDPGQANIPWATT